MSNKSKNTLRDDWSGAGAFGPISKWMNAVARMLQRVHITGGSGHWSHDGLHIVIPKNALAPFTQQVNQTTNVSTISEGRVIHGVNTPIQIGGSVTVSGGTISNPTYAVLEYSYAAKSAAILSNTVSTFPVSDANTFRVALHEYYISNGAAYHLKQRQYSDIIVPGFA